MAQCITLYWRDIPAQIIVKKGRKSAKKELSQRFSEAIDMAAMRSGAAGTDDYLNEWRRSDPIEVTDDLEVEAEKAAEHLETLYDKEKLHTLIAAGGRNHP